MNIFVIVIEFYYMQTSKLIIKIRLNQILFILHADTAVPEKPEKDSRYLNNSHSAPNLSLSPKNTRWLVVQLTMESEWALVTI